MYINRTGINSPIAKIVKLDTDTRGVRLAQPSDTVVLGVVTSGSKAVEVAVTGIQRVFICNKFSKGDTVYLRKYNEKGGNGTCYASTSPTVPYLKIGECMENGSGRAARVMLSLSYQTVGSISGETDPVFTASAAVGVTSAKLNHWDTAYDRGDHPATHPATMITEDTTHRFVTDAEKVGWGAEGISESFVIAMSVAL